MQDQTPGNFLFWKTVYTYRTETKLKVRNLQEMSEPRNKTELQQSCCVIIYLSCFKDAMLQPDADVNILG